MNDLCIDFVTFHLPHLLISTTKYGDSGVNGCRAWIIDILSKLAVFLLPYEISSLFPLANADVRASVAVDDGAVFFLIIISPTIRNRSSVSTAVAIIAYIYSIYIEKRNRMKKRSITTKSLTRKLCALIQSFFIDTSMKFM